MRLLTLLVALWALPSFAQEKVPPGSKVFVAATDGFDTHLKAAIEKKKVPITVVEDRAQADYELAGTSDSAPASAAKKLVLWDWRSTEQASVRLTNIKSGVVAFAYSVHKSSSAHGKRSTAEACAKHLHKAIAK